MESATGRIFFKNGKTYPSHNFQEEDAEIGIYEAFRVYNSKPLFIKDHIDRLKNSLYIYNLTNSFIDALATQIKALVEENNIVFGNIKISLKYNLNHCNTYVYQLAHAYPSDQLCRQGVHCIYYEAERNIPHAKSEEYSYKHTIKERLDKHQAFEGLLLDHMKHITEGTRTNVFFIKGNVLYSAPESDILQGVTRKHVLHVCRKLGINYIERRILQSDLQAFEAAFLTGTSIQILPIRSIDTCTFDVTNTFLVNLMRQFKDYLSELEGNFTW